MDTTEPGDRQRWCIFHRAPDKQVAWHDEDGTPITFGSEREAQHQIVEDWEERIAQFKSGERDFDDIVQEDWIEEVAVDADGKVHTEHDETYGKQEP